MRAPSCGYDCLRKFGRGRGRTNFAPVFCSHMELVACQAAKSNGFLDAAHVTPYRNETSNVDDNGLLLRSDLHVLLDSNQMAIHPKSRTGRSFAGRACVR
jgi:putative restriction endonuclease